MEHGSLRNDVEAVADNGRGAVDDQRVTGRLGRWPEQRDRVVGGDVARGGATDAPDAHDPVGHGGVDRADVRARTVPEREQVSDRKALDGLGELVGSDLDTHAVSLRRDGAVLVAGNAAFTRQAAQQDDENTFVA